MHIQLAVIYTGPSSSQQNFLDTRVSSPPLFHLLQRDIFNFCIPHNMPSLLSHDVGTDCIAVDSNHSHWDDPQQVQCLLKASHASKAFHHQDWVSRLSFGSSTLMSQRVNSGMPPFGEACCHTRTSSILRCIRCIDLSIDPGPLIHPMHGQPHAQQPELVLGHVAQHLAIMLIHLHVEPVEECR